MRFRPQRALLLVPLLLVAACAGDDAAPPPTARVDRGTVAATVSASGTLEAITEQQLGFAAVGQVAELLARVGDRVGAGQVIARLDDFAQRQTLAQRQATLATAVANLDKVSGSPSISGADDSLDQNRSILDATRESVNATNRANDDAVERREVELAFQRKQLERANDDLEAARAACTDGVAADSATSELTSDPADEASATADTADDETTADDPVCDTPEEATALDAAEDAVAAAKGNVITAESNLSAARSTARTGRAAGKLSIEQAENSVVTARNNLDTARNDNPADIRAQQGTVDDARAQVAQAQRDVDARTLKAPVDGTVATINGAVGEYVAAASGGTGLAPGSLAALPSETTTDATNNGAGTPFLVLDGVDSFRVVVPYEEADAARVAPDQRAEVTVDAIPGVTLPGTVVAVAPSGQDISGVVNFYATVVLNQTDPALRDGQTAEVSAFVESVDGVLRVPSAAVTTTDGATIVRIPGPDGAPLDTPFEPGLVGDEFTEVRSGLAEGQVVLLPQADAVATQPGAGPGG